MAKKSAKISAGRTKKPALATKKTVAKSSTLSRPPKVVAGIRRLQRPNRSKAHKQPLKLPPAWQITKTTALTLWHYKVIFLAITGLYALLNLMFVQGLTNGGNTSSLQSTLNHITASHLGSIISGLTTFIFQSGSSAGSATPIAGFYQLTFALITTLAVIWTLRQLLSGKTIRIRDAYYKGMYPLIPFILVLIVICLQLLPMVVGAKLYSIVITGGIAINVFEKIGWLLLFLVLTAWSIYMISATVFALYIVTLPDMTPLKAIRMAKELVRYRRLSVILKTLTLPLILLLITSIVMLPTILAVAAAAPWVLFLLTMAGLVAANSYMYTLYRELLNE